MLPGTITGAIIGYSVQKFGVKPKEEQVKVFDNFIRKGKSGEGKKLLSKEQIVQFDENFKEFIAPIMAPK